MGAQGCSNGTRESPDRNLRGSSPSPGSPCTKSSFASNKPTHVLVFAEACTASVDSSIGMAQLPIAPSFTFASKIEGLLSPWELSMQVSTGLGSVQS